MAGTVSIDGVRDHFLAALPVREELDRRLFFPKRLHPGQMWVKVGPYTVEFLAHNENALRLSIYRHKIIALDEFEAHTEAEQHLWINQIVGEHLTPKLPWNPAFEGGLLHAEPLLLIRVGNQWRPALLWGGVHGCPVTFTNTLEAALWIEDLYVRSKSFAAGRWVPCNQGFTPLGSQEDESHVRWSDAGWVGNGRISFDPVNVLDNI